MHEDDFAVLRGLHDGAITFLDARVRDLYDMLARRRVLDNTIFIVMGDHGDSIGEHGLMSHKFCVYDTLTRVLLLIKYPTGTVTGKRDDDVVQHTDILPTVLDAVGLPETSVAHRLEGNSLIGDRIRHRTSGLALTELMKPFGREALAQRDRMRKYDRQLFALRSRDYKFIWASDGRHECFNVAADPEETCNLFDGQPLPAAAESIRRAVEAHRPVFESSVNRNKHRI
jgi:arylsulfatase A-like enzyme